MRIEDKQLLLKDICARLPYHPYINVYNDSWEGFQPGEFDSNLYSQHIDAIVCDRIEIKPYLRPMSSMTEVELKELNEKYGNIAYFFMQEPPYYNGLQAQHSDIDSIEISEFSEIYDWLNSHHFDFRGLIEKGLAIEAPAKMYKND